MTPLPKAFSDANPRYFAEAPVAIINESETYSSFFPVRDKGFFLKSTALM